MKKFSNLTIFALITLVVVIVVSVSCLYIFNRETQTNPEEAQTPLIFFNKEPIRYNCTIAFNYDLFEEYVRDHFNPPDEILSFGSVTDYDKQCHGHMYVYSNKKDEGYRFEFFFSFTQQEWVITYPTGPN